MGGTVLVVQHEEHAPAGWLGDWLVAEGCALDVRRPYDGEPLPADLADHDGLVVLGGSMDSWDEAAAPWLPSTRALVRDGERRGVPVLGVCLGHQVAVLALGGEVGRNPAGGTIAVLPVGWGAAAHEDPLFGGATGDTGDLAPARAADALTSTATHAVHWNNDVVLRLPEGGEVLAVSPDGAIQAARLGRSTWGVQCHPEVGPEIVASWVAVDGAECKARGVDVAGYTADVRRLSAELHDGWRPLATRFAALVRSARTTTTW